MARNWPHLPAFQSKEEALAVAPDGWTVFQIEDAFEKLDIGKRFDQKSAFPYGRVVIVDQSADGFVGFHNEEPGIQASQDRPVITFANHTCEMRVMRRPFSVIQNVFPMAGKQGVCDTMFFYYATKGRVHLEEYKGHFPDFRRLWISVPPLATQKTIAHILGTIDDKIELNRRMNATLEGMAKAVFREWFGSGMGASPMCMDGSAPSNPSTAHGRGAHATLPEGWEIRSLDQIANFLNGLALQKYPPGDGPTLPVIKIAQLRKGDTEGADRCNTDLAPQYIINDGDVLFSWSGSLEVELWCGGVGALNQHLFKVTSTEFPKWFYYMWTLHHLDEFRLVAADKATTMGHIQRRHLTAAQVIVPSSDRLEAMTRVMGPIVEKIISNRIESRTLVALRDRLLPTLLSGKLNHENNII